MELAMSPTLPWLDPAEQKQLVTSLLGHGLIRFSNDRDLPVKSGGKTDIYMDLRSARNRPASIAELAFAYENPLRRLRPHRFIEVPDAVSCIAGPLSVSTGIPYLTIRSELKQGRVGQASYIGSANRGEKAVIMDDVITDGASKVGPYVLARDLGLQVSNLVVLVDRQNGWQETFRKHGIDLNVWPGMTLHDVRRLLISDLGIMRRCDPAREEKNPIIVALDGKSWDEILPLIDHLRTSGVIWKVNDLLFGSGIDDLIPDLQVYGRVMADLKAHDIPQTVTNTCWRLRNNPPWAVTIHASGGLAMIEAAVKALEGTPTKVLVVTVLTSIDEKTGEEIYHRLPLEQVQILAWIGANGGAHGFVCSPQEVAFLKASFPDKLMVTPGIRSDSQPANDQARIGRPKDAIDAGSTHLVIGRQIMQATDPAAEVVRILKEELRIVA